ncbi:MAG: hypothetical protein NVS9B8_18750 [Candidatus Limnocylindrales bacterium]
MKLGADGGVYMRNISNNGQPSTVDVISDVAGWYADGTPTPGTSVAVAGSLASALERAERVEELALLAWRAAQIGGATVLSAAELDDARDQMARFPRQRH